MRLQKMLKVYTMSSGKGRLGTLYATRNLVRIKGPKSSVRNLLQLRIDEMKAGIRFIETCPRKLVTGI